MEGTDLRKKSFRSFMLEEKVLICRGFLLCIVMVLIVQCVVIVIQSMDPVSLV